jgi:vacuolar-type H+-ATPase subunit H
VKEIIEQILQEEREAHERIEKAREQAKKIRLQKEAEAQEIISQKRESTRKKSRLLIKKAESDEEKIMKEESSEEVDRVQKVWQKNKKEFEMLTDELFQMFTGQLE